VDLRKGFDGWVALVEHQMGHKVQSGDVYLFVGRRRHRAQVLYFDGTGLCLLCKRLEKGRFARLDPGPGPLCLSLSELGLFLEGCELVGKRPLSPPHLLQKELAISSRM
jgi:transposase